MCNPSLMHTRIGLKSFETFTTIATAWSDHNIFDLTSSHFDSYCFSISHNHDWLPPLLPLLHCTYAPTCHQIPLVSPKCSNDGEESGALTSPKHLSQEPLYMHKETSDASANSDLTHIHGHGCVTENDVPITMDTEELVGEAAEMMDMAADSKIMIFSPTKKAIQAWRHPGTNPSHDLESVSTEPTVDTNDSLDCTNENEVLLSLFSKLFGLICDLGAELDASMDELFQPNSGYNCPLVATATTILMPCLLNTKNQSRMMILSECHLTLYDTVDCIANPLPLLDLLIVGQSHKQAKAMMYGDEGIGVDGLKELVPGPSFHDSIHDGDIMEQAQSHIHYELVPLPHLTTLFQLSSEEIRHFLLSRWNQLSGISSCQGEANWWQCFHTLHQRERSLVR